MKYFQGKTGFFIDQKYFFHKDFMTYWYNYHEIFKKFKKDFSLGFKKYKL